MSQSPPADTRTTRTFLTVLSTIVAAIVIATSTAMEPGSLDVFRMPKDAALLSLSLLLITVGGAGALLSDDVARLYRRLRTPPVFLALAAAAWTGVASVTSLRPGASLWAPLTVVCFAAFFSAALLTARRQHLAALLIVLMPAVLNAVLATLQSTGIWVPWVVNPWVPIRIRTSGLIGNPNDLGTYLVLPALAALAAGLAWPRHRWLLGLAAVLVVGIASAQSVTPFAAAVAGVFIMAITSRTRRLRLAVAVAALALFAAAIIHPGSRQRFQHLYQNASAGQLPEMTSFRIVPAVTAFEMFRDRPLVGVGPGTYSAIYMTWKQRTDEKYPQWVRLGNEIFGQVHNDHMQVLAETGLPGYLIFVSGLALLACISLRRNVANDPGARFARIFALPAAAAFAVLSLAQFPMQLTAPMVPALYLSALCFAWVDESAPDESATDESD